MTISILSRAFSFCQSAEGPKASTFCNVSAASVARTLVRSQIGRHPVVAVLKKEPIAIGALLLSSLGIFPPWIALIAVICASARLLWSVHHCTTNNESALLEKCDRFEKDLARETKERRSLEESLSHAREEKETLVRKEALNGDLLSDARSELGRMQERVSYVEKDATHLKDQVQAQAEQILVWKRSFESLSSEHQKLSEKWSDSAILPEPSPSSKEPLEIWAKWQVIEERRQKILESIRALCLTNQTQGASLDLLQKIVQELLPGLESQKEGALQRLQEQIQKMSEGATRTYLEELARVINQEMKALRQIKEIFLLPDWMRQMMKGR